MSALLCADGLSRTYSTDAEPVRAVSDVSLSIAEGEFVSIMGASGSGKSTLLHLLGGLIRPTSGTVHIDGADLSQCTNEELARIRQDKVGFVFQAFNLVPVLDAIENVQLPATIAGHPARASRRRATELLELVGLADQAGRRPNQLSGGEQQRVAVARALMLEPAVILADEPTGNLDTANAKSVSRLLIDLNRAGQTIVLVTHDIKVGGLANRHVRMRDGHIVDDRHDDVPEDPRLLVERVISRD